MAKSPMSDCLKDMSVGRSVEGIEKVLASEVLERKNSRSPLFEAAVVHTLICLNDLLGKANARGQRVDFTDDVGTVVGKPKDVTTLVNDCRNAACHMASPNVVYDTGMLVFNVFAGKVLSPLEINGVRMGGCDYEDDIAVQFGPMSIYIKRHILRAYAEAREVLGV